MCPVAYFTMTRSKDHSFDLRFHLVQHAQQHGIRAAAAAFQTSRNTVRKRLHRYQESGLAGLQGGKSGAALLSAQDFHRAAERQVLEQRLSRTITRVIQVRSAFPPCASGLYTAELVTRCTSELVPWESTS